MKNENNETLNGQKKPISAAKVLFLLFLIGATTWIIKQNQQGTADAPANAEWIKNEGTVFGTIYHLTYLAETDMQTQIEAELAKVDSSLSMFNQASTLSKINRNESTESDEMLDKVFTLARQVSQATDGAFDVTVAPLVNAWGFGYKNGTLPTDAQVDSLCTLIGWQRVTIEDGQVKKDDPRMVMDFSAIAKGFGCDVVADYLRSQGIKNFMVEIGGEVVCQGQNPKSKAWRVGVNKPIEDSTCINNELEEVLELTDVAMATSGNYRNYYVTEDGRKLAHTIDPKSGRPVQHSVLSATVLAPTCAEADAFATSFMVMGLEKAQEVVKHQPQLKALLIISNPEARKDNKEYLVKRLGKWED